MNIVERQGYVDFHDRITRQHPPCAEPFYYTYKSGIFGGGQHPELDEGQPVRLLPAEQYGAALIAGLLESTECVQVIDLGGRMGLTLKIYDELFSSYVANGRLQLIVTNHEQFSIEHELAEAARRLELREQYSEEIAALEAADVIGDDALLKITLQYKQVVSPGELSFMQRPGRIRYVDKFDTLHLASDFPIGSVALIHEHIGGIRHHNTQLGALAAIFETLHPVFGVLMTTANIEHTQVFKYYHQFGLTHTRLETIPINSNGVYSVYPFSGIKDAIYTLGIQNY